MEIQQLESVNAGQMRWTRAESMAGQELLIDPTGLAGHENNSGIKGLEFQSTGARQIFLALRWTRNPFDSCPKFNGRPLNTLYAPEVRPVIPLDYVIALSAGARKLNRLHIRQTVCTDDSE